MFTLPKLITATLTLGNNRHFNARKFKTHKRVMREAGNAASKLELKAFEDSRHCYTYINTY